ncbi:MAG: hypothetical protein DME24_16855 [Verrucomicrobia bacterium]|nr:MAG: hypothetical protein DME24_16855 [Verrucomicrobiota bacterium]
MTRTVLFEETRSHQPMAFGPAAAHRAALLAGTIDNRSHIGLDIEQVKTKATVRVEFGWASIALVEAASQSGANAGGPENNQLSGGTLCEKV